MRLLNSFSNADEVHKLSSFLTSKGIENSVDIESNTDWGDPQYGTRNYKIWIIDEDKTDEANQILKEFEADPDNARYSNVQVKIKPPPLFEIPKKKVDPLPSRITLYLIAICTFIYFWGVATDPQLTSADSSKTYSPIYTSFVKQIFLFDFPKTYELLNQLVTTYGIDALQTPQNLPPAGVELVNKLEHTPYWQGLYQEALTYFSTGALTPKAPWFEKIGEGEIWRFVTPIFLHGEIFHILFNMVWLYVLGKQLEMQLKPARYILFIIIAAAFSNTVQYLLSGPNFIGFSGVVCAMLAFIWKRQQDAPWEGYQLQKSTFNFMMIFIFGMLGLQLFSFFVELSTGKSIATSIANGAHIAGLLIGWLFAKIPFFTRKRAL